MVLRPRQIVTIGPLILFMGGNASGASVGSEVQLMRAEVRSTSVQDIGRACPHGMGSMLFAVLADGFGHALQNFVDYLRAGTEVQPRVACSGSTVP